VYQIKLLCGVFRQFMTREQTSDVELFIEEFVDRFMNQQIPSSICLVEFLSFVLEVFQSENLESVKHNIVNNTKKLVHFALQTQSLVTLRSFLEVLLEIMKYDSSDTALPVYLEVVDHCVKILYEHEEKNLSPDVIQRLLFSVVAKIVVAALKEYTNYDHYVWTNISRVLGTCWKLLGEDTLVAFIELFQEQDDLLIDIMNDLLTIYNLVENPKCFDNLLRIVPDLSIEILKSLANQIHPHRVFREFLKCISSDHTVLLDFLISDDTNFLTFLLQYVHFSIQQSGSKRDIWYHSESEETLLLEDILPTLIRLRMTMERIQEKKLLVYDVKPLLRRLEELEQLWESNQDEEVNKHS